MTTLYISPVGSGVGSFSDPMSFAAALATAQPGNTYQMRAGTYSGTWNVTRAGTQALPITWKPYGKEHVVVDGALSIQAADNVFRDLEIMNSDPNRLSPDDNTAFRPPAVDVLGVRTKLINCVIHDGGSGIGYWSTAAEADVYGCVIYNNGWRGFTRGMGHGFYGQGNPPARRYLRNCIVATNFSLVGQIYGSDTANVDNYTLEDNIFLGGNVVIGGQKPMNGMIYRRNAAYDGAVSFGYIAADVDAVITDNTFAYPGRSPIEMKAWQSLDFERNACYSLAFGGRCVLLDDTNGVGAYTFEGNDYRSDGVTGQPFVRQPEAFLTFTQWKAALGLDATSTFVASLPASPTVILNANTYDAGRFHLAIYNWQQADSVTVDLSSLPAGSYRLRNVQDYYTDVVTITAGASVAVDMRASSHSLALPIGWDTPLRATTFPRFGAFLLESFSIDPIVAASNHPNARYHRFPLTNIADTWDLKVDELL